MHGRTALLRSLVCSSLVAIFCWYAGGCDDGGSGETSDDATAAVASQLALASALAELAASSAPPEGAAQSIAGVSPKGIPGFDCSLSAPVNTCRCPGGGSFVANLSNFTPSSTPCGPVAGGLRRTQFAFQYDGTFADCEVRLCGQDVVVNGPVTGNLNFTGDECTAMSSIDGTVQTADPCDGLQVTVGSTAVTVGTNSLLSATGTSPSTVFDLDMSGSVCAAGFMTSFGSLEDIAAQLDPSGTCGIPGGGQPGDCAPFDQNNVDFRECAFDAVDQVCTFYVQFDSNTSIEKTCAEHCTALGGSCIQSEEEADRNTPAGQCLGSGLVFNCEETFNSVICTCSLTPSVVPTDCANVVPGNGGFGEPCRSDADCGPGMPCCTSTDVSAACGTQVGLCECI